MGEIFEDAVQMGSGAIMCIPSFREIGPTIQRVDEGDNRQHGYRISLLLFFS
jgi:hypothetical protein